VKVWDAVSGQECLTLKGHSGQVYAVAYSPDGRRLASAGLDGTVKVWNAATGQETLSLKGHTGSVYGVAYSPDGRRIASAGLDGTVKVWDAATGQEYLTLKGHTGPVSAVAYSPDSRRLASAHSDQTVKVWDATDLTPQRLIEREARGLVQFLMGKGLPREQAAAAIRRDPTITEAVRQQALAFLEEEPGLAITSALGVATAAHSVGLLGSPLGPSPFLAASALVPSEERYAAIWHRDPGSAQQTKLRLTAVQFEQAFSQLANQGYRLVQLSGYSVAGEERYTAIWEKGTGPAQQARHRLTPAQFEQALNQLAEQGYRLVQMNGYNVSGEERYAAIWDKATGPAWEARHGLTATQFEQVFNQLANQGYRLVRISGYGVGGEERFAAIWNKGTGAALQTRYTLTSGQFQGVFDQMANQGYRLVQNSGYCLGGEEHYAAVWDNSPGPAWQARHALTAAQFERVFNQLAKQGYRLVQISGYSKSGGSDGLHRAP
jgi:uncharacterized protein (UPF0297 family)